MRVLVNSNASSGAFTSYLGSTTDALHFMLNGQIKFKRVYLNWFSAVNGLYNVYDTNNANRFYYNNTSTYVTITPGSYAADELADTLNTALGATIFTFNDSTMKYTASPPSGTSLLFGSSPLFASLMQISGTVAALSTVTGTNPAQLDVCPTVGIRLIDGATATSMVPAVNNVRLLSSTATTTPMTFVVPLNVNRGEVVSYFPEQQNRQYASFVDAQQWTSFAIELWDTKRNQVLSNNNLPYQIELEFL